MSIECLKIFKLTSRRTLETVPASPKDILKIKSIVDPKDIKEGLSFPLPDVFAIANGKADIAICIRGDGGEVKIPVPQGQRYLAQTLG